MKSLRKALGILLSVIMTVSCLAPAAFADELENEEELIAEALEEVAAEDAETQESISEEEPDETEESEEETLPPEDVLPASEEPAETEYEWQEPGNDSVNILAGGLMLQNGECFYYVSDGAIYCDCGDDTQVICYDDASNLNLVGDMLYYTCAGTGIMRVSVTSCESELVYSCPDIDQLYVCGSVFYYLSGGEVFRRILSEEEAEQLSAPESVNGFIPTSFGCLYLTGDTFEKTVWVENAAVYEGVESCYTEDGYLVISRDGMWQIELGSLFTGETALEAFDLHQDEIEVVDLPLEEQLKMEAAFFDSELYAENEALGEEETSSKGLLRSLFAFSLDGAGNVSLDGAGVYRTAQQIAISNNDMDRYNIVRRARQQTEVLWTPLYDRYAWGARQYHAERTVTSESGYTTNYFVAGQTYQGIPYSQAVNNGSSHPYSGYVGWDLSVSEFVSAVNSSGSRFYSGYSTYSQTAPAYGSDCSGFVSWAWDLPYRCTCSSLVYWSKYIGNNINQLQLGDCLNCTSSHVILVTDIGYDSNGNIVSVEITEQTPLIMRVTIYGEKLPNKTNPHIRYVSSLSSLQSNYLNNGYDIYRRDYEYGVSYESDPAVPLNEDGWLSVPSISFGANSDGTKILVSLSHNKAEKIYYTTDGTTASTSKSLYTGPIELTKTTTIHAVADAASAGAKGAFELVYTVDVEKTSKPVLSLVSGAMEKETVQSGSMVTLESDNAVSIYYTTDGTEPTRSSSVMPSGGIKITGPVTIKAFAVGEGTIRSDVVSFSLKLGSFHTIKASASSGGSISPSGSVKVLDGAASNFTFTANKNYKIKDVVVDGSSIGAKSSYKFSSVTGDHEISVKFVVDLPFTDVKETAWYADAVAFAYTQGLFNGVTSSIFNPSGKMTRGMFVTVLGRFAGQRSTLEGFTGYSIGYSNGSSINIRSGASTGYSVVGSIPSEGCFVTVYATTHDSDGSLWYYIKYGSTTGYVKAYYNGKNLLNVYDGAFKDIAGQYYCGYIQWASMKGLVSGKSASSFSPNSNITRQDLCVILYNYITSYCGVSMSTGSKTFTDDSSISGYAKTAVHALANSGIINGYEDGSFLPKNSATRAEVATMFMRMSTYLYG